MKPSDFKDDPLLSTFGMSEYEHAISLIIEYLADDSLNLRATAWAGMDYPALSDLGWKKLFRIDTVAVDPSLFAMLCASGWISSCHFPKYTFRLSEAAIDRLREKRQT